MTAEWHGTTMGCAAHIVVDDAHAALIADVVGRLRDWEVRWSRFRPDSELSALNRSAGDPTLVAPDTAQLIALAIDAWHLTDGRFDPTVHDAVVAAGYGRPFAEGPTLARPPTPPPGPAEISVDPVSGVVSLPPNVRLDLGGVAKGHAADLLVSRLRSRGATGAAVTIGGDTAVAGTCPFASAWPITAVPGDPPVAHLEHGGYCYSTTARRRWAVGDGWHHHIIDPASGKPTATELAVVAVAAAAAATAEVFATAALVAGDPVGLDLVASNGLSGFAITEAGVTIPIGACEQNPPDSNAPADGRRRE